MKPLKVINREGIIVSYNPEKIEKAIMKAMKYGSGMVDEAVAKDVSLSFDSPNPTVSIAEIENYVL